MQLAIYRPELVSGRDEVLAQRGCRQWTQPVTDQRLVVPSERHQWRASRRHDWPSSDCVACLRRWMSRRRWLLTSGTSSHIRRLMMTGRRLVTIGRPCVALRHLPAVDRHQSTGQSQLRVASCCYSSTWHNCTCSSSFLCYSQRRSGHTFSRVCPSVLFRL